ncbi:MAG: FecR domain-containing protein [Magnetococcales bacterium]|nr:FecR domain-containing protein [Magnetococcales bacterium]
MRVNFQTVFFFLVLHLCFFLVVSPLQSGEKAAFAFFVSGNVTAQDAFGNKRALMKGSEIKSGESVHTQSDGVIQMRFSDGGIIAVYGDSQFNINEYRFFDDVDKPNRAWFGFQQGMIRSITGKIGKIQKQNFLIKTPLATIGIRGTEFLAEMKVKRSNQNTDSTGLTISVIRGAISLDNQAGHLTVFEGRNGYVPDSQTNPQFTDRRLQVLSRLKPAIKNNHKPPTSTNRPPPVKRPELAQRVGAIMAKQGVDKDKLHQFLKSKNIHPGMMPQPDILEAALHDQGVDPEKVKQAILADIPADVLGQIGNKGEVGEKFSQILNQAIAPPPEEIRVKLEKLGLNPMDLNHLPPNNHPPFTQELIDALARQGLKPDHLQNIMREGMTNQENVLNSLQEQGVDTEHIRQLLKQKGPTPSPEQMLELLKKSSIDPEKIRQAITMGLRPPPTAKMQELKRQYGDDDLGLNQPFNPNLLPPPLPNVAIEYLLDQGIDPSSFKSPSELRDHLIQIGKDEKLREILEKSPPSLLPPQSQ